MGLTAGGSGTNEAHQGSGFGQASPRCKQRFAVEFGLHKVQKGRVQTGVSKSGVKASGQLIVRVIYFKVNENQDGSSNSQARARL